MIESRVFKFGQHSSSYGEKFGKCQGHFFQNSDRRLKSNTSLTQHMENYFEFFSKFQFFKVKIQILAIPRSFFFQNSVRGLNF